MDRAQQAAFVFSNLGQQTLRRIHGDAQQRCFEFFQRMRAGQRLDDEPVLGVGQPAAPEGGDQAGLDHRGLAAAARPDDGYEAIEVATLAQAGQQLLRQGFASEEVGRIGFLEGAQALVGIGDHDRREGGRRECHRLGQAARVHDLPQVGQQGIDFGIALQWIFGGGAGDDVVEGGGQALPIGSQGRHRRIEMLLNQEDGRGAGERLHAGQHLIQHHAQAVDVGLGAHGLRQRLFRGQVGR